ncbi:helix-turn-helix domain-containing protein [Mesoplasma photuris]|uniref:helix-turn-helix domain-containing protein n=1 Tax=Mesoplasma photuris TaxID=217731 RepID=UPI0004E20FAE|nr:helix-turn-helix transcriptional regulator [Mesoplasma photuris]
MENNEIILLFAMNMKRIRLEKKMSQEDLSFAADLHRNYISDVECGRRNVSLQAIAKIAAGLEIEVSELFNK